MTAAYAPSSSTATPTADSVPSRWSTAAGGFAREGSSAPAFPAVTAAAEAAAAAFAAGSSPRPPPASGFSANAALLSCDSCSKKFCDSTIAPPSGAGIARRARGPRQTLLVQDEQHGLAVPVKEAHVADVPNAHLADEVDDVRLLHRGGGASQRPTTFSLRSVAAVHVHRVRESRASLRAQQHRRASTLGVRDDDGRRRREAQRGRHAAGARRRLPRVQRAAHERQRRRVELHDAELGLAHGEEERVALLARRAEATSKRGDRSDGAVQIELRDDFEGYLRVVRVDRRGRGRARAAYRVRDERRRDRGVVRLFRRVPARVVASVAVASDGVDREAIRLEHDEVRRRAAADRVREVRRARVVHPGGGVDLLVDREGHPMRPASASSRPTRGIVVIDRSARRRVR
eukprot:30717-Pelagococcus_subviridis.AAC.2